MARHKPYEREIASRWFSQTPGKIAGFAGFRVWAVSQTRSLLDFVK